VAVVLVVDVVVVEGGVFIFSSQAKINKVDKTTIDKVIFFIFKI
jgi:hypothetical protein